MKSQNSKQHANAVAVQPQTTLPNEDQMKKQSSTLMKLALFVAVAITMALPATAATCNANSCSGQIARVYVTSSGNQPVVYISMVGGSAGLDCSLTSGVYFTLPSTQLGYLEQYNLLLQAKTTNTPIIIRAIDYSNGCTVSYVLAGT